MKDAAAAGPATAATEDALLAAAKRAAEASVAEYLAAAERAHAAARASHDGDRHAESAARLGAALVELGEARRRSGDVRGAMAALDEAVDLARSSTAADGASVPWLGTAHHRIGVTFDTIGDPTSSVEALRHAIEAYDRGGDDTGVARVRNSLGIVYSRMGSYAEALAHFAASLRHAEANGHRSREAAIAANMAVTTLHMGEPAKAITFAERALAIKREVEPDDVAGATTNLALALAAAGDHAAAAAAFEAGDVAHERRGDPFDRGEHVRAHAEYLLGRGRLERVAELLDAALALAREAGSGSLEAEVRRNLASYWKVRGDYRNAIEHLEACHALEMQAERALRERAHDEQRWQAEIALARSEAAAAQRERRVLSEQFERLVADHDVLSVRTADLEVAASSDPLTGAANRRALSVRLAAEVDRAALEATRPCSLILIDLDDFKDVNDGHGHLVGDDVLRGVVAVLHAAVRATDTVARIGGDEFAVLLPVTERTHAAAVARTIRTRVAEASWPTVGTVVRVTASIGVASSDEVAHDADRLLAVADARLYEAKAAGRDHVVPDGPARMDR